MPPVCKISLCYGPVVLRVGKEGSFFCQAHAPSGRTSPVKARLYYCDVPGCSKKSLYGWPGSGRVVCLTHARPCMSKLKPDVQCNVCGERATYLYKGKSNDGRCNKHKASRMILAAQATLQCDVLGCNAARVVKAEGWRAFCCGDHASSTEGKASPSEDPSSQPRSLITPPIADSRPKEPAGMELAQETALSESAMRARVKARQELQSVLDLSMKQLRKAEKRHEKLQGYCRQLEAELERLRAKRRRWKEKVRNLQQEEMEEVAAIEAVVLEEVRNVAQKKDKEEDVSQAKVKLRLELKRLKGGLHAGQSKDKKRLGKVLKSSVKKRYSALYSKYDLSARKSRVEQCKQDLRSGKAQLAFNNEQRQRLQDAAKVLSGV